MRIERGHGRCLFQWTVLLGLVALAAPASAQELTFTGQVRPRHEFRDPSGDGKDESTSMRVRLGLQAQVDEELTVFIQLQDVRIWGEETHPLFDAQADRLDLHQGYLQFRGSGSTWLTTTVGRMEVNQGGQRLLGAVDWTQQGQSFDGIGFDVRRGWGGVDAFAFKIGDETAPSIEADAELYGVYATLTELGSGALDLYWIYDRTEGAVESNRHTIGARYAFRGVVNGRLEGTIQAGTSGGEDVSSFMVGARLGRELAAGRGSITLWYDYLSGDDPTTPENEAFHTLYGTNHKFYGLADLFLNIPVHTGGAGLQDAAVKFAWSLQDNMSFGADFHSFSAAEQGTLASTHFANELDLTLTHRYSNRFSSTAGFSFVMHDDALAEVGRLSKDMTWLYVMLNAVF